MGQMHLILLLGLLKVVCTACWRRIQRDIYAPNILSCLPKYQYLFNFSFKPGKGIITAHLTHSICNPMSNNHGLELRIKELQWSGIINDISLSSPCFPPYSCISPKSFLLCRGRKNTVTQWMLQINTLIAWPSRGVTCHQIIEPNNQPVSNIQV